MSDARRLNIVDEAGNVIGEDMRENIHKKGLMHREAHVWLYTPRGEILFQHRAKNAETSPDLLDASVGGHVEIGSDFLDTAVKEMNEEMGSAARPADLRLVRMVRANNHDATTGRTNNVLRAVYAYRYTGRPEDLHVEDGKAQGFEAWPIGRILTLPPEERGRFIPSVFDESSLDIFRAIQKLF